MTSGASLFAFRYLAPLVDGRFADTERLSYFLCALQRSQSDCLSRVSALLRHRGPAAVFRRVRTVVINSINRMVIGWPTSHVCDELFDGVAPTLAYVNATAAVVRKRLVVGVFASAAHSDPRVVLRSSGQSMLGRECRETLSSKLSAQTSATLRSSSSHRMRGKRALCSAFAPTQPDRVALRLNRQPFENGESPKHLAGYVFDPVIRHECHQ